MNPADRQQRARERTVFEEVSELADPAQRAARLATLCGEDLALRVRLERLLAADDRSAAFFDPPREWADASSSPTEEGPEKPGTVLGRYRLGDPLGEGGFGRVYQADQLEPVRRPVALKLLKPGMPTREVLARFEAERQALAMMDHPHVAHVLDAGTTPAPFSRPFFVMELVEGPPITQFCDRERLPLRQRIALMLPVCLAVQHAHQKGILHRDLKPTNILVSRRDGRPHPMVIDFGIAKALQEPLTPESSQLTRADQVVGTPAYMSPEQAAHSGQDIDTRSDIYALGVILYELFTGQPPFSAQRLRKGGPAEMQRILQEEDPEPPSARARRPGEEAWHAATARGASPAQIARDLAGELDWIVQKALEKDRNRRYATANALARDLERYLHDEPVQARPPDPAYLARKFYRRHRPVVLAVMLVLLALVAGLLLATVGLLQARQQRNFARKAEAKASAEALAARRIAYASDMNLAWHAVENSNLGLARQLLHRQSPHPDEVDLRGWEWSYLAGIAGGDHPATLGSHTHAVTVLALADQGRLLASGGLDGTVKLWDLPNRRLLATLPDAGSRLTLDPAGLWLATSNPQIGLQLWDLATRQATGRLWTDNALTGLAFAPATGLLCGVGQDGRIHQWDLRSRTLRLSWDSVASSGLHVGDVVLSSDDRWILHGGSDGQVRRFEAASGQLLRAWKAHPQAVTALALSADDTIAATGAGFTDTSIELWKMPDGSPLGSLTNHRAWIATLAFSPSQPVLASGSADQTIRLWSVGAEGKRILRTLRGHLSEVWALAFAPDGQTLVSGGKDGTIHLWPMDTLDPANPATTRTLRQVAAGPRAGWMAGLDEAGRVCLTRRDGPASATHLPTWGQSNGLLAVATGSDQAAVVDRAGVLRMGSLASPTSPSSPVPVATNATFTQLAITWDGTLVAAVSEARSVQVFDTLTRRRIAAWDSGETPLSTIAVSTSGPHLASGGNGLTVYELLSGRRVVEIQAHLQPIDALAFSREGRLLATASQEGLAKVWDASNWKPTAVMRGHLLGVHAVAFSPDGRRLATGSVGEEAVKLWDLTTRQEVLNLPWTDHLVRSLQFSGDGLALLATGNDDAVRVWEAQPMASK